MKLMQEHFMDRTKTKGLVAVAVGLASTGFLVSGLIGVWNLATAPAPIEKPASSQDAQVIAQENGLLAVLKDEPKNASAIQGMEAVVGYYLQKRDNKKAIQSLEKLIAAAPKAKNAEAYKKKLAELNQSAQASPAASPSAK
jgi:hypothetical protein